MNDTMRTLKRLIALGLCQALILLSAGPEAFAAAGRAVAITRAPAASAMTVVAPVALSLGLPGAATRSLLPGGSHLGVAGVPQPTAVGAAAGRSALSGRSVCALPSEPSAEAALDAAATQLSAPTSISRVASTGRIAQTLQSARSIFGSKSAVSVAPTATPGKPSALASPVAANPSLAPAPPPSPATSAATTSNGSGGWFGLGSTVALLIGAMLIMQVGLEAQGAAMAQLTEQAFGDFSILARVTIFAQIGSMLGQQLAQPVISKLGLARTYYAAHFLRALSIGAMIFLIGAHALPLSMMYVFYAANGVMTGIAATADGTMRKIIIGSGQGRQEKFRVVWQFSAEVVGVIAPILFGSIVAGIGPGIVTALYPAAIVAGLLLLIAKKVLPADEAGQFGENTGFTATVTSVYDALAWAAAHPIRIVSALARAARDAALTLGGGLRNTLTAAAGAAVKGVTHPIASLIDLKDWFKSTSMYQGFQFVWYTPILKYSFLGAAVFDMLNLFLYRLLAPGCGKLIGGVDGMSAIAGMILGLFSLGGLITAVMLLRTGEQSAAQQRASLLRWTLLGAPAVLLLASLALPLPTLGTVVALPKILAWAGALTVPAAVMIPFGFFQVAASIKLNASFIDNLPDPAKDPANKEKVQKAIAFEGSAMTAMSIAGMLAMQPMFSHLQTFNPFPWLALATLPLAAVILFIQRKLAAASKPAEAPPTDPDPIAQPTPAPQGRFATLDYAPLRERGSIVYQRWAP